MASFGLRMLIRHSVLLYFDPNHVAFFWPDDVALTFSTLMIFIQIIFRVVCFGLRMLIQHFVCIILLTWSLFWSFSGGKFWPEDVDLTFCIQMIFISILIRQHFWPDECDDVAPTFCTQMIFIQIIFSWCVLAWGCWSNTLCSNDLYSVPIQVAFFGLRMLI